MRLHRLFSLIDIDKQKIMSYNKTNVMQRLLHNDFERMMEMPPKPKYTKEEVVKVALDMVREQGVDSLTARDLGAKLGTSSRPIFTAFENMDDLKNAVTDAGVKMFKEYSKNFTDYTPAFKQMGMQIISFATKEPKLFEFLFMQKNPEAVQGLKTVEDTCVDVIAKDYGLSMEQARMLFEQVWIFTFGLATLSAMKVYEYTEEQISDMLTREFVGAVMMMKSDLKKINTNKPEKNGGKR